MGLQWARPASVGSDTAPPENLQANQAAAPEEETFQVTLLSINGEQHVAGHRVSHACFYVFKTFFNRACGGCDGMLFWKPTRRGYVNP